jgi:hypothetical protein
MKKKLLKSHNLPQVSQVEIHNLNKIKYIQYIRSIISNFIKQK